MGDAYLEGIFTICLLFQFQGAIALFMFTFIGPLFGFDLYLVLLNFLFCLLLVAIAVSACIASDKNIPSLWLPFFTFMALDLFAGLFSICSLSVRTPPWLHFMEYMNWRDPPRVFYMYLTLGYIEPSEPLERRAEIFFVTLLLAAVLLVKSYFVKCVWTAKLSIKAGRREERQLHISAVKLPEKGLLPPSNEEAVALPAKEPPAPAGSG